ncbi:vWA domain-containing protein [Mycolicibacterium sp.]|uniref:vWA domain-containing protein n=1 Tax=Mycolicibacterium sp. TaxID=2320850 RepID=UPI001A2E9346|nr:vWA domain-containing protein [Mycolicibacterium sp.]MBJ7341189.1 VWA domain-containing protein [Mycolicibacterium sp.]
MTDPQRTLIAVLLDRSGSMESIKSDTEGGFNAFIAEQAQQPGEARVTLAQFDTEYEVVYAHRPIAEVPRLELQPRSMTALNDALGRLITDVGAELAALPEAERPGQVIVLVMTDGLENSSVEWTHEAVRAAVKRQEREYAWDFVFLGANIDAVAVGQNLGFSPDKSLTYAASDQGVASAMASTTAYVSRKRGAPLAAPVAGFSDEDRVGARGDRR